MKRIIVLFCCLFFVSFSSLRSDAQEQIDVLFLTKSSGYEHGVINRENGELGHAEKIMHELAEENNFRVVVTKDAGLINKKNLKQFDVVQFYTTGNLCERGGDKNPPMSDQGRKDLIKWVQSGGAFVGTHSASDTFHNWTINGEKPYVKMLGGEFQTHGAQQEGEMTVKSHPTTAHLSGTWNLKDEYYVFKNMGQNLRPLLILDTKKMKEDKYTNKDPYPTSWYKPFGNGRVWHTALGHRADVWTNEKFQELVVRGIQWAAGNLE